MRNIDKFIEVFGFKPSMSPILRCKDRCVDCKYYDGTEHNGCSAPDWWTEEYEERNEEK